MPIAGLATRAIQIGVGTLESNLTLDQLVAEPLAPEPVLTVLSVASRLANIVEYLEPVDATVTVQGDRQLAALSPDNLSRRRLRGNTWLSNYGPLALAASGWAVVQRGDYLVPLASDLLDWADRTHRCTTDDKLPDELCTKLGGSVAIEEYVRMARRLVREVPEFRANVAAWRVRQALGVGAGQERADGTRDASSYDQLLNHPAATSDEEFSHPIRTLLPGRSLYRLARMDHDVPHADQPHSAGSHWYMRLSGDCLRFQELKTLADNAKTKCSNGTCRPATTLAPTVVKELDQWEAEKLSACVLAPLPLSSTVEAGRPRGSLQVEVLLESANNFVDQLVYYTRLSELSAGTSGATALSPLWQRDPVKAVELATFVRPPEVAPWRYAFPRSNPAR